MQMLMEMTMVARLAELGKPATFELCSFGSNIDNGAVVQAINAARLTGRAALHAECENADGLSLNGRMEDVRTLLAVHALHEGELAAEASEPQLFHGKRICRVDLVCTDHPSQRDRPKKDAPATETKPENSIGDEPELEPGHPGYR